MEPGESDKEGRIERGIGSPEKEISNKANTA
jgi:hypothetical protein